MKIQSIIRLNGAVVASLCAWALLLGAERAHAQANANPPNLMTYQGFLVDGNGNTLATNAPKNYDVVFRIWDNSTAGELLWAEQQTVTVDKGYFSVLLGEGSSIGEPRPNLSALFTNSTASDRWVGITVKGIGPGPSDVNILPRLRLLPTPYSFLATRALTLDSAAAVVDGNLSTNVALRNVSQDFTGVNTFSNATKISGANALEFGAGVAGKQQDAGKIGYQTFTSGSLDIVGAGTTGANRKIKFHAEGGSTFNGPVSATAYSGDGTGLSGVAKLSGNSFSGAQTFGTSFTASSIDLHGRMNLWSPFGPFYGAGLILNDFTGANRNHSGGIGFTLTSGEWSSDSATGDITIRSVSGKVLLQSGTGASAICITTGNRVGIGTTSPSTKLHVVGSGNASQLRLQNSANSTSWDIYSESNPNTGHLLFVPNAGVGGFIARSDGLFRSLSDVRLKTDIMPLGSSLERVLKLRPVSYRFKSAPDGQKTIGFIAQEVEPLFPELVSEANGFKGLAYAEFAPISVAAIQELHQVVRQQEAALSEKTAQVDRLEKEVAQLKKQMAQQAAEEREREDRLTALETMMREATRATGLRTASAVDRN